MRCGLPAKFLLCPLLILGGTVAVFPCKCVPGSLRTYYRRADAVVVAKVVSVATDKDQNVTAKLEVLESWKRNSADNIDVITGSSCAYDFQVNEKHVLYLRNAPSGNFSTMRCQGNLAWRKSQSARTWLNRYGKKSKVELSLLFLPEYLDDDLFGLFLNNWESDPVPDNNDES